MIGEYVDFEEIPNPNPPEIKEEEIIEAEVEEIPPNPEQDWFRYWSQMVNIPRTGRFEEGNNRFDNLTDIADCGIFSRKHKPKF